MIKRLILLSVFICFCLSVSAQIETPAKWSYGAKKINNVEAVIFLKATIEDGWHVYSAYQKPGGPTKTSFAFSSSPDFDLLGKVNEPKPITVFDKVFEINVSYFEKSVVFQQKIKLKADQTVVKGKLSYMVCSNQKCIPDEINFSIPVN